MGLTSLLLVSSLGCGTCSHFKPIYVKLEEKIKNFCSLYIAEAEHMGGRHALREGFAKHLGKRYDGFPSLFIVANGTVREVPYDIMWSKKLNHFDVAEIAAYIEKYLLERKLL